MNTYEEAPCPVCGELRLVYPGGVCPSCGHIEGEGEPDDEPDDDERGSSEP